MFVTATEYEDYEQEEGAIIYEWMLRENNVDLPGRYNAILAMQ